MAEPMDGDVKQRLCQFVNEEGEVVGAPVELPVTINCSNLAHVCNAIHPQEEAVPFSFFVYEEEIISTLEDVLKKNYESNTEHVLSIVFQPQAVFRVLPVARCSSTIEGHTEAVLNTQFSPDGKYLASASGDTTVRFWDLNTEMPQFTCRAHSHWVLCLAWSPNGLKLASGCKSGQIAIWDPESGKQIGRTLKGHKQWITWLCWKPLHLDSESNFIASSSKDCSVKIWNVVRGTCVVTLSGHTHSVTCVKWGGTNLLYTASHDRTLKVWRSEDGTLCRTLSGHAHWVNHLALNTDYALRTSGFDPANEKLIKSRQTINAAKLANIARERYESVVGSDGEQLVSASDDFTMFLWRPEKEKRSVARMVGHQQLVNQVVFSPDCRLIASASFDKSVKLWDGKTGKFLATLRGHIQRVYQVAWSADSRLLVSGSADSTLKVWNIHDRKLMIDLPGHADEVFAVDWSPDGQKVASGGRDKVLKLWRR